MEKEMNSILQAKLKELEDLDALDDEYFDVVKEYYPNANKIILNNYLIISWYEEVDDKVKFWYHLIQEKDSSNSKESYTPIKVPAPNVNYGSTYITTTTDTSIPYNINTGTVNTQYFNSTYSIPNTVVVKDTGTIYVQSNPTDYYTTSISDYTNKSYEDKISTLESKVDYLMGAINGKVM